MRALDYTVCVSIVYVLGCMYVYNDYLVQCTYVYVCVGVDTFIPIHILWVGVALITMYVINAYQRKGDPVYCHSFHSRRTFNSCTLVIKWSTSVIRGVSVYITKYLVWFDTFLCCCYNLLFFHWSVVDIESHVSSGRQGILSSLAIYCGNDYQKTESVIFGGCGQ